MLKFWILSHGLTVNETIKRSKYPTIPTQNHNFEPNFTVEEFLNRFNATVSAAYIRHFNSMLGKIPSYSIHNKAINVFVIAHRKLCSIFILFFVYKSKCHTRTALNAYHTKHSEICFQSLQRRKKSFLLFLDDDEMKIL